MRPTLRRSLICASLLTAFVITGCGDGQNGAAPSGRAHMGAAVAATAAETVQPVIFSGVIANYTVTKTDAGYVVTDSTGADAPRTVAATARLRFADMSMAFDVEGTPGQAYRLYRAAFAREPDAGGLGYWIGALDHGASLYDVAGGFTNSVEFQNLYAGAKTNRDIISRYYVNVLKRQGEQSGMDYWTGILDDKRETPSGVLRYFSEGEENKNGTAAAIAAGVRYVEYGVRYPATTYPLRAAYQQSMSAEHTDFLTVAGTCPGNAALTYAAPVATTFEDQASTALATTVDVGLNACQVRLYWTQTDYYDSNAVLQGFFRQNREYDVGGGSLPAAARIGDKGVYATQTAYADSTKKIYAGKRTLSYALDADGDAFDKAVLTLTAVHTDTSNATTLTRTTRYRAGTDGTLQLLTVDERYGDGAYLVYTPDPTIVQPAKLIVTDTVAGTGAVAQNKNTLTVNYTGWLYDPKAPDLKGQKFDSSVGRQPFEFQLGAGKVISGWEQGMLGMRAGGKRTLVIPSPLGYGAYGSNSIIKPNTALVFDVELISVR
ncbi:hypothetical protein GCM10027277_43200 [Pseudoduganella ginsengisoli]|uniref:peptidylprolyl isomerase n=1 Tax=Pseudoduganella ginsengisoli TaxID=1462440 RepID=A0A6L6Q5P5_9BURK|nr:FKBP-type peptidyl-prolyl cis-trans isomerase [Pseudoduganella ginsengisoli]MTW05077.1 DUF4214 domain-containing protein [Pseudoduganella ginsengisoli]